MGEGGPEGEQGTIKRKPGDLARTERFLRADTKVWEPSKRLKTRVMWRLRKEPKPESTASGDPSEQ